MMTEISALPTFEKDVKKLAKKYPSLPSDLQLFLKALRMIRFSEIRGTVRIANLGEVYAKYPVYKVRSFRCVSLRGQGANSGIRVIYYDDEAADMVTLIQMYHKSTDENHDVQRICQFLDSLDELN